ncbi:MAG: hypothetical protein Q4C05_09275 [Akkermansia sp.]|nr:hypothetical protein [Akkermansia sp.]
MNRKITRTIAFEAAERMADAKFKPELDKLMKIRADIAESYVKKYIPYAVRAIVDEYPSYFESTDHVLFSAINPDSRYGLKLQWVASDITIRLPKSSQYVVIDYKDYLHIRKSCDAISKVMGEKEDFSKECQKALYAIKSEGRLKEQFPAAIPYVVFPEVMQLPSVNYNQLNKIVESINTEDNG